MLAIDTDLIVRYLAGDDAAQAVRARKLIDNNEAFACTELSGYPNHPLLRVIVQVCPLLGHDRRQ